MSEVFCNTSPLIYLHRLGLLDLLRQLHGKVVISTAVKDEIATGIQLKKDVPVLAGLKWLEERRAPLKVALEFPPSLGPGEREAILLASGVPGSVVLLDDKAARNFATRLGVRLSGTLATLVVAHRRALVGELGPILDILVERGFRMSRALREITIKQGNTASP
jgi:predicted nucleic acid-binding protein